MPNSLKSLLPCPFCGGEAIDCTYNSCDCCGKAVNAGVMCTAKGCSASTDHHDTESEAATAWNTRAPIAEGGGSEHVAVLRDILESEYMPHDEHGGFSMERAALTAAIESLSRQGGEDLDWLRPFAWTSEQDNAWHRELPDISKSFDALIAEVRRCRGSRQTRASEAGDHLPDAKKMIAAAPAPGGGRHE